jgi:hypothetical protein
MKNAITKMKSIFTIILVTSLILACNPGQEKESHKGNDPAAENHSQHEEKAAGLVLNNGAKWKADSITVLNVSLMQSTISSAQKESPDDFRKTAALLQDGLNKMVAECKMKGPDHDALHQWLEPLMEKVKVLNTETDAKAAVEKLGDIDKQLALFTQYFE